MAATLVKVRWPSTASLANAASLGRSRSVSAASLIVWTATGLLPAIPVASAIAEQGSATNEIAQSTQQAFSGTQLVAGDVAGMTEVVAASGTAAERVRQACGDLAQQASRLRQEVDRFIGQIRAA